MGPRFRRGPSPLIGRAQFQTLGRRNAKRGPLAFKEGEKSNYRGIRPRQFQCANYAKEIHISRPRPRSGRNARRVEVVHAVGAKEKMVEKLGGEEPLPGTVD